LITACGSRMDCFVVRVLDTLDLGYVIACKHLRFLLERGRRFGTIFDNGKDGVLDLVHGPF